MRILALKNYHACLEVEKLTLCPVPPEVIHEAQNKLDVLQLTEWDLWSCLIYIPLPFKDAAVLIKACRYGVGYEAAAVISFATQCRLKQLQKAPQFDLDTIIKLVTDKTSKAPLHVAKLFKARELFETLTYNLKLWSAPKVNSHLRVCPDGFPASVEERLAVAFLGDPERLLWCDEVNGHGPSFLGEPVVDFARNGCHVAVLLAETYTGLKCFFSLPATQWVLKTSGVQKPEKTARIIGDSTLMVFRKECCNKLRQQGYDVKVWHCKGETRNALFDTRSLPY